MASPFNVFRKNQKVLIVIVGLMAMISFVILAPLMGVGGGGGGANQANNPLVLTSDYGDLNEYDVERLQLQQSILYSFLNTADQERWIADGRDPSGWRPSRPGQVDRGYAIQTYLLANKADEMGIVVDDNVINHQLEQYKLGGDKIREMLGGYRMDEGPMTVRKLFEAYRMDIKASRVRQAYGLAVPGRPRTSPPTIYTPAQSFENYRQLHDQIQIESVAVPVEDFVDQIKDPTPSELETFFEKYKEQLDVPLNVGGVQMPAPEPGFKFPPKASFNYLEGNYLAYIDLVKQQVTDEEIAKYYEDNKRQYEKLNLLDAPGEKSPSGLDLSLPELDGPPIQQTPDSAPTEKKKEPAAESTEKTPEDSSEKPVEKKESAPEKKPADEVEKAETGKSAEGESEPAKDAGTDNPETDKPTAETPADKDQSEADKPAEKPPADAKPEDDPQSGLSDKNTERLVLSPAIPTQFVNFQDDPESPPKADEPAEDSPAAKSEEKPEGKKPAAEDSKPAEPAPPETKPEQPKSKQPAVTEEAAPETEKKDPAAEGTPPLPADDPAKKPADEKPETKVPDVDIPDAKTSTEVEKPETPAKERPVEYKPLAEVEDEIRQELANQRAGLSMLEAMEPLKTELDDYWNRSTRRKLLAGDKEVTPLPPGFMEKVKASHLIFKETSSPLSYFELNEIPLGLASVPMEGGVSGTTNIPLAQYAFIGQMAPFQAVLAEGDDGNKYLAWKVSESEERVPELDEVRAQVILAWKMMKARDKAEAEAKRLADKAKDLLVPLDKAFGDEDVAVQFSSPFTWLTRGSAHQFDFNAQLRLGEISGITGADNDFMKAIFELKVGEITSLMNFPKDAAYVVRVSQRVIPIDTLREQYLRDEQTPAFFRPWDQLAQQRIMSEVNSALLAEVEQQANVVYHEREDVDEIEE